LKGLGKLKNSKELVVVCAPVTDADLVEIKALTNLTTLQLGSPRSAITDAGLKELQPLKTWAPSGSASRRSLTPG
jgi:hypothetical protein